MIIANALASRITLNSARILPANTVEPATSELRTFRPVRASPAEASMPAISQPQLPESPDDTSRLHADEPASSVDSSLREHFRRGLGAYPLRNREPTALLTVRDSTRPIASMRNT
eukprot:3881602-Pleurochrysis_carterae.AAC.1